MTTAASPRRQQPHAARHTPAPPPLPGRRAGTRCPACGTLQAVVERSRTEQILEDGGAHPLDVFFPYGRLHARHGAAGGPPPLSERFLAWLDGDKPVVRGRINWQGYYAVLDLFREDYPVLSRIVGAHLLWSDKQAAAGECHPLAASMRMLAREQGIDDHTVARQLARGRCVLKTLAAAMGLYV